VALADSAWAVRAVPDPQEALRALAEQPFHVLVTDLRLPGMSGLELIRRARLAQPSLRVVLMSAFGEPKDIVEAMRLGADDFLPKPFDLDAFLALLDRLRALGDVEVLEQRHVRDGRIWTSAGIAAGTDQMLAFIASEAGAEAAGKVQLAAEYYPEAIRYGSAHLDPQAPAYLRQT